MSLDDLTKVVEQDIIPIEVAEKYLNIFVAKADWKNHIRSLWNSSGKKILDQDQRKDHIKRAISCATLISYEEGTTIPNPPENILFWCTGWEQFKKKDWFSEYKKNIKNDIEITQKRSNIIKLGVIDPVDVSPMNRQAFNWIYEKCRDNGKLSAEELKVLEPKIFNLVKAYGGAVICNVFVNHKNSIEKIFSWRSGYFLEKEIHKIYSIEDIIKIKTAEIRKTNPKYIKKIVS